MSIFPKGTPTAKWNLLGISIIRNNKSTTYCKSGLRLENELPLKGDLVSIKPVTSTGDIPKGLHTTFRVRLRGINTWRTQCPRLNIVRNCWYSVDFLLTNRTSTFKRIPHHQLCKRAISIQRTIIRPRCTYPSPCFSSVLNISGKKMWSCKFLPTGKSRIHSIPRAFNSSQGPIPDNINNWGLLTAPADTMTSLLALITCS